MGGSQPSHPCRNGGGYIDLTLMTTRTVLGSATIAGELEQTRSVQIRERYIGCKQT